MWSPISLETLREIITLAEARMEASERRPWNLLHVPPNKWDLHPWGDLGGGFWVIGLIGRIAIWYNDIEHGFNVTEYCKHGELDVYQCNQDSLDGALWQLRRLLEMGEGLGGYGPPSTIVIPSDYRTEANPEEPDAGA